MGSPSPPTWSLHSCIILEKGGAGDEQKNTQFCEEPERKTCEVSYENDPKDSDIQLRATREYMLYSRSKHMLMIVRKIFRNAIGSIMDKGDEEMQF